MLHTFQDGKPCKIRVPCTLRKGGNQFVGVYLSAKRLDPCEVKGVLQPDKKTIDLFLCGGTHWSTVFLFDQKDRKHESGFHGDDPDHAAVFLSRHV